MILVQIEVPTCSECKFWNMEVRNNHGYCRCDKFANWQSEEERASYPPNGFCCYGEKKIVNNICRRSNEHGEPFR